jgi:hypothetical protein
VSSQIIFSVGIGGKATQVTRDSGHFVIDPFDSKSLYYSDSAKLFRSDADGAVETELLNDLAWSRSRRLRRTRRTF